MFKGSNLNIFTLLVVLILDCRNDGGMDYGRIAMAMHRMGKKLVKNQRQPESIAI